MENAHSYPPRIAALLQEDRLCPLGPGRPNDAARALLDGLTPKAAFTPQPVRDPDMAAACLAGLWLYHDFLEESHKLSQDVATPTGSYWHGLMHRREPDFGNAKYWFRRVGPHPVFEPLQKAAAELATAQPDPAAAFVTRQFQWDPMAFIDLCATVQTGAASVAMLCRRIQQREWQLLFHWTYQHTIGQNA